MVFLLSVFALDFGPMAKYEALAKQGNLGGLDEPDETTAQPKSGRVADMIVPILVLIVTAILGMLYNGGYWSGDPALHNITAALGNCVAAQALVWGSFAGIVTALLMYVPRKLMTFKEFMDNFTKRYAANDHFRLYPDACMDDWWNLPRFFAEYAGLCKKPLWKQPVFPALCSLHLYLYLLHF